MLPSVAAAPAAAEMSPATAEIALAVEGGGRWPEKVVEGIAQAQKPGGKSPEKEAAAVEISRAQNQKPGGKPPEKTVVVVVETALAPLEVGSFLAEFAAQPFVGFEVDMTEADSHYLLVGIEVEIEQAELPLVVAEAETVVVMVVEAGSVVGFGCC